MELPKIAEAREASKFNKTPALRSSLKEYSHAFDWIDVLHKTPVPSTLSLWSRVNSTLPVIFGTPAEMMMQLSPPSNSILYLRN